MNGNSPITEVIIEPICERILNYSKINNNGIGQLSLILIIFSLYFLVNYNYEKSSLFYLVSYILFWIYKKENNNESIDMIYFIVNIFILIFVLKSNINLSQIIISLLIFTISYLSYCIKTYNLNNNTLWNKSKNQLSSYLYPEDNNLKEYHFNNFWKIFDFSFLVMFIYIIINMQ